MKTCGRCRLTKEFADFTIDRGRKDGRNPYCRDCTRAAGRQWHAANKTSVSTRKAAQYRAETDRLLARNRHWRTENRERERATNRRYYYQNKDLVSEWHRKYYEANKEAFLVYSQRRRAMLQGVQTICFTTDQLMARWAYYGNKCWICGGQATATDHVKPLNKGGAHMLCNCRPICKSCNSAKRDQWPLDIMNLRHRITI